MKYTAEELKKKFKGKYIKTLNVYNYDKHAWEYEVVGISKIIKEEHNLPEDEIIN